MVEPSKSQSPAVVLAVPSDLAARLAAADDAESAALRATIGAHTASAFRASAAASRELADAYVAVADHLACLGADGGSAAVDVFPLTHALRSYAEWLDERATRDEDYAAHLETRAGVAGGGVA